MPILVSIGCIIDYLDFIIIVKSGSVRPSVLSSFSKLFFLFYILCISIYSLETDCQCIPACWDFNRDLIELIDQFGENCHHDNIESSNPWTWNVSPFIEFFFDFFYHSFIVFLKSYAYFVRLIPNYFIFWSTN